MAFGVLGVLVLNSVYNRGCWHESFWHFLRYLILINLVMSEFKKLAFSGLVLEGGGKFVYNRCGRSIWGLFIVLEGVSTVQMTPYSVESHLQIAKIERSKILKRESLFSEEKKPENHFFVRNRLRYLSWSKGWYFVSEIYTFGKMRQLFHFLSFFDTFWTILYIIVAGRWQFVYNRCGEVAVCI